MSPAPSRPDLRPGRPRFVNSGYFTPLLISLLCLLLLAFAWERGRGNVHRLTSAVLPSPPAPDRLTGPGGEDALRLTRTPDSNPDAAGSEPQFLEATLLPGRGMNLFQLTAQIPGHGRMPLLVAPPLEQTTPLFTNAGPDANGALSATMGGAFLVPWAGQLVGNPSAGNPQLLQTLWLGQHLTFPAAGPGSALSTPGLLLNRGADAVRTNPTVDGQTAEATFNPGTFSGNWTSTGTVHVTVELSARALDLAVSVQNTGASPMPVGVGWLPFFAIRSGDREHATLTLPSATRLETARGTGMPTGLLLPVTGTPLDFSPTHGAPLGRTSVDDTYVHLTSGADTELRDTAWGYGLRVRPLSTNIKALRVLAPPGKPWVALGPYTNVDDALGSQWSAPEGSGIRTLQPGESLEWKVRVELFALHPGTGNPGT